MIEAEVEIINRLGLHARAAARFVRVASGYESEIKLRRGHRHVNGKSIMGVMMLAASMGTRLVISANGSDEQEALQELKELVADRFGEEE